MLEQCCYYSKQCSNNVATLCFSKNRCCDSSQVTSPLNMLHQITTYQREWPGCCIFVLGWNANSFWPSYFYVASGNVLITMLTPRVRIRSLNVLKITNHCLNFCKRKVLLHSIENRLNWFVGTRKIEPAVELSSVSENLFVVFSFFRLLN